MHCCDVACIVLGIFASICSVSVLTWVAYYARQRFFYEKACGHVVEVFSEAGAPRCYSLIRFRDHAGKTVEIEHDLVPSSGFFPGRQVKVVYHASDPDAARVTAHEHDEQWIIAMLGVASAIILLTFADLFWRMIELSG